MRTRDVIATVAVTGAVGTLAVMNAGTVQANNFLATPFTEAEREFINFIAEHRRSYGTKEEYQFRLERFTENYNYVQEHNAARDDLKLAMNMFSDFTEQEYKMRLGKKPTRDHNLETASFGNSKTPSSWDWIAKGALGPVKDQGQCGSCWTFAGVGAVEAINKIENGVSEIYSEQQLVDCAVGFGCNGGWAQTAMKHLINNKANYGSDYRYTAKDGTCKENQYDGHFSIGGVVNVEQNSELAHVEAVY